MAEFVFNTMDTHCNSSEAVQIPKALKNKRSYEGGGIQEIMFDKN